MILKDKQHYARIFHRVVIYFIAIKLVTCNKQEATLIFAGDITFDGPVRYFAEVERTCGYQRPFDKIKSFLKDADIRIANLESPLIRQGQRIKIKLPNKRIHHSGLTKATKGLLYAGFDIVQLANNHMADFGSDAIASTVEALEEAGISQVGLTNRSSESSQQKEVIKVVNGVRIGFLAYCWNYEGCNVIKCQPSDKCNDEKSLYNLAPAIFQKRSAINEIRGLHNKVDIVVVLMHWGKELAAIPSFRQRTIAKEMKVAGAHIIMGAHPHVIQGHECVDTSSMVVYSLGNFLLPKAGSISKNFLIGRKTPKEDVHNYLQSMNNTFDLSQLAYIFKIKVSRSKILTAQYLPIEIQNEEGTNCLQPIPKGDWINFCAGNDRYCYNYASVYAKSPSEYNEQLNTFKGAKDYCIKGDKPAK